MVIFYLKGRDYRMRYKSVFTKKQEEFFNESVGKYRNTREFYEAFKTRFKASNVTIQQVRNKINRDYLSVEKFCKKKMIKNKMNYFDNKELVMFFKKGVNKLNLNNTEIQDYVKVLFNVNICSASVTKMKKLISMNKKSYSMVK